MAVTNIKIERFSIISSKAFDAVVAAIKASVGQPDMAEFAKAIRSAPSFAELERALSAALSSIGLMLFMELDHGAILRRESGHDTPKIVRLVIGNPLIMKEMVKHVPDAGSYAPVTVLIDERADGVHPVVRQDGEFSGTLRKCGRACCRLRTRFKNRDSTSQVCSLTVAWRCERATFIDRSFAYTRNY